MTMVRDDEDGPGAQAHDETDQAVGPEPGTASGDREPDEPGLETEEPRGEEPKRPASGPTSRREIHRPSRDEPSGWSAVKLLLVPRTGRNQLAMGALCALLGFAVVVQVHQTSEADLTGLSQTELVRIADAAGQRADALTQEAADLQAERDALVSGSDTRAAALAAAERNALVQGILAGRLPAVGPGVTVSVEDPDGKVRPTTLLNLLEELRNAGAEAVSVNGVRVVASSAFTGTAGAVMLDGQRLRAPYTWSVIGDPTTMATALQIPGGAAAAVSRDGGRLTVAQVQQVNITATVTPPEPQFATPVPDAKG
ncbi:MAG: DUF881 domain-containing protein [Micrococcales bacterium]|nr:DUF881 domain-containing protein [Micrococcales bacterium]